MDPFEVLIVAGRPIDNTVFHEKRSRSKPLAKIGLIM